MAVAHASPDNTYKGATTTTVDGPTPTPHHAVSVIELDSILDHVPMDRSEPAPDGFFDWIETLLPPVNDAVVFVTQPGDEHEIPHWYNWILEQHAIWFREKHPDDALTTFGVEFRGVQDEDEGHIVTFPGVADAKSKSKSADDSGADDGKVSGPASQKTGSGGSTQSGTGTVQRTSGTAGKSDPS